MQGSLDCDQPPKPKGARSRAFGARVLARYDTQSSRRPSLRLDPRPHREMPLRAPRQLRGADRSDFGQLSSPRAAPHIARALSTKAAPTVDIGSGWRRGPDDHRRTRLRPLLGHRQHFWGCSKLGEGGRGRCRARGQQGRPKGRPTGQESSALCQNGPEKLRTVGDGGRRSAERHGGRSKGQEPGRDRMGRGRRRGAERDRHRDQCGT